MARLMKMTKVVVGIPVTREDFTTFYNKTLSTRECCLEFRDCGGDWGFCPKCGSRLRHTIPPFKHLLLDDADWVSGMFWMDVVKSSLRYNCDFSIYQLVIGTGNCIFGYCVDNSSNGLELEKGELVMDYVSSYDVQSVHNALRKFEEEIQHYVPERIPRLYFITSIREG